MNFYWGKKIPGWTFIENAGNKGYYRMEEPGCLIILEQKLLGFITMKLFLGGHLDVCVLESSEKRENLLELLYLGSKWLDDYNAIGQALLSKPST
ncbi:hypothetical protein [Paenibacillus lautus]|uniref:hypothetical protein n=1 Tax=Paenibacillus lautus TaxID=1401 RepID=UPI002DBABF24|nr:hypothetical protein [Paenibacillus lautus]MEC0259358.1 hypothetical protein [Paenibacillus lautus]